MAIFDKQQTTEFDLLDPETIAAVPDLRDPVGPGARIHESARLAERLETERKRVIGALSHCSCDGPMGVGSGQRFNPENDAHALLAGANIVTLKAPVEESERSSLLRQLRALEAALPEARDKVGQVETEIVTRESEKLREVAQGIVGDVVAAAENLLACLQTQNQFFSLLAKRGFHGGKRPGWMNILGQEIGWLVGDNHRPPLSAYIQSRRASSGLPAERE